jgi:hypothetical protein
VPPDDRLQHDARGYRAKWGLKPDYPMVAPSYVRKRQELAKKIDLGRKPRIVEPVVAAPQAATRKPRAKKAAAWSDVAYAIWEASAPWRSAGINFRNSVRACLMSRSLPLSAACLRATTTGSSGLPMNAKARASRPIVSRPIFVSSMWCVPSSAA